MKRIVHTSSVAAIQSYDKGDGYIFTEKDEVCRRRDARKQSRARAQTAATRTAIPETQSGGFWV